MSYCIWLSLAVSVSSYLFFFCFLFFFFFFFWFELYDDDPLYFLCFFFFFYLLVLSDPELELYELEEELYELEDYYYIVFFITIAVYLLAYGPRLIIDGGSKLFLCPDGSPFAGINWGFAFL